MMLTSQAIFLLVQGLPQTWPSDTVFNHHRRFKKTGVLTGVLPRGIRGAPSDTAQTLGGVIRLLRPSFRR
jgi:hypothetical protein